MIIGPLSLSSSKSSQGSLYRPEKHGHISILRSDVTSEVIWRPSWPQRPPKWLLEGNMHIDTKVIEVADFKYEVKICH